MYFKHSEAKAQSLADDGKYCEIIIQVFHMFITHGELTRVVRLPRKYNL